MADYVVEREQRIEGAPSAVYERIVDFHRWQAWSPWDDIDPELWRGYEGAEAGVGAVYEWAGNRKAGTGKMTITAVEPAASVTIELQFLRPFKSKGTVVFTLAPDGSTTVTRWTMTGRRTPMLRFFEIFSSMDKIIGPDFEKGLARLKADVESS